MERIGIFICHCSLSPLILSATEQLRGIVSTLPGVVHAGSYSDLCLDPGLLLVKSVVLEKKLDGVVMASCSAPLYERAFRGAMSSVGLGEERSRLVDLRPHGKQEKTVKNTINIDEALGRISGAVKELRDGKPPSIGTVPVTKRALVIGGGIAGIQASLDIADAGYQVLLVERSPSIGGHMAQYSEVFPTLDCPQCILTPKMVEVGQHPNITLLTYAEVQQVSGTAGNFRVRILRKARKVNTDICTGCGVCWQKCPEKVLSEYEAGVAERKAIYIPFPQAVPAKAVIDTEHCRYIRYQQFIENREEGKKPPQCRICEKLCPAGAIDWEQQSVALTEEVGAIVVATGFDLMPVERIPEYDEDPDVIDGIQFERILAPNGPTAGAPFKPSDMKTPGEVVFVSCAGSRDPEHGVSYCSRVCCMYLAKQALLYREAVPDGKAYVFYIDTRTTGKRYEEFLQRVVDEGTHYIRGKVSRIFREGEKLVVMGADTLSGRQVKVSCDLVVLGMAILPSPGIEELAGKLGIDINMYGFITENHPKLSPLETTCPGIFLAGAAQGPKDIPDSVAQGSGAAAKVLSLFSHNNMTVGLLPVTHNG
jgi:heterodisulfide reductase subunit A